MSSGRPRASSREALSDAACELFLERGFEATSVTEIAARAGVSRSSFFNYFDSKDAILWAALDRRIDRLVAASPAADPLASLHELGRDFEPDSLALALVNADAMGLRDELERAAAVRQSRIGRAVAASFVHRGDDPVSAAIAGAAHAGAVMIAIERWALAGAGRSPLAVHLDDALARAAGTGRATQAGGGAGLD